MADARTLLRQKRQESTARITHPYASYTSAGQLRCSACGVTLKSAAMWEGHIGSKSHRVAVKKMKEKGEEEIRRKEVRRMGKRKAEEQGLDSMDVDAEENANANAKKRRMSVEPDGAQAMTTQPAKASSFPADFFSDPSKAPLLPTAGEDEDENEESAPSSAPQSDQPKSQVDLEWERFQASLLASSAAAEDQEEEQRAAYERATVAAEPELAPSVAEGFPPDVVGGLNGVDEVKKEETEEEKRRRKEQEERELIMDRLIEEERAQEEADERVGLLKARVEALKRAREAKRKAK